MEITLRNDRREIIKNFDGYGKSKGVCGDTVEMFLQVSDNRIKYVSFNIDGCLNTSACANTVVFLAEGRSIEKAWEITPKDVIDYLETLPSDHAHCAELAVGAFYKCLAGIKKARNFGHGR